MKNYNVPVNLFYHNSVSHSLIRVLSSGEIVVAIRIAYQDWENHGGSVIM